MENNGEAVFIVYNSSEFVQSMCFGLALNNYDLVLLTHPEKDVDVFMESIKMRYDVSVQQLKVDFHEPNSSNVVWKWCKYRKVLFRNLVVGFELEIDQLQQMTSIAEIRTKQIKYNLGLVDLIYALLTQSASGKKKRLMMISDPLTQTDSVDFVRYSTCREFVKSFATVLDKELDEYNSQLVTMCMNLDLYHRDSKLDSSERSINYLRGCKDKLALKAIECLLENRSTYINTVEDAKELVGEDD